MKKNFLKILLVVILVVCNGFSMYNVDAKTINNFESGKEILYYVFYTNNGVGDEVTTQLQNKLKLSEDIINKIKSIGLAQHNENNKIKQEYNGKTSAEDILGFNNKVKEEAQITTKNMKDLLGMNYNDTIDIIQSYWYYPSNNYPSNKNSTNKNSINNNSTNNISSWYLGSDMDSMVVYATQFYPNAGYEYGCALPDKRIKAGYLNGVNYTLNLHSYDHDTYVSDVPINEVGPWNIYDDYWHINRILFNGLELGDPEATRAYFEGYNGGLDDENRIVTNPAGIDLTPEVAAQLGFGYLESGYVEIHLNF